MAILDTSSDGSIIKYKEEEGKIVLVTEHSDTKHLEKFCAEERANSKGKFEKKNDFHRVMKIPLSLLTKISAETGLDFFDKDDAKKILEILKAPEYEKFRTYKGKI